MNTYPGTSANAHAQPSALPITTGTSGSILGRLDPAFAALTQETVFNPRDNMQQSFLSKQETFKDRIVYLATFFEGALFQTPNQFMTQDLFPFRMFDDINFSWTYLHAPSQPALQVAHHTGATKNKVQRRVSTATMRRYGSAMDGSSQSDRTSIGQTITLMKMSMTAHAFASMFELNGFRAVFRLPVINATYFFESQLYGVNVLDKITTEVDHFDIIRSRVDAFSALVDSVQQTFAEMESRTATDVIIPERVRSIISSGKNYTDYYLRGDGNTGFADLRGDAPELDRIFCGVRIHVARPYYFDGAGISLNPLQRYVQTGGFGIADNFNQECRYEDYRTRMSETAMFDMDSNGSYKWMSTEMLVCNNERFDAEGNLVVQHREIAASAVAMAAEYNLPITDNCVDMFIYAIPKSSGDGVVFNAATHWGQLEDWALKDHALDNIAGTSAVAINRKIGSYANALKAGADLIECIRRKDVSNAVDQAFMQLASPAPADGQFQSAGNRYGAPNLPTRGQLADANIAVGENYIPAGFGTFGGIMTLGDAACSSDSDYGYISKALRDGAVSYVAAVRAAFNAYVEIYHAADPMNKKKIQRTHPALLAENVPEVYKSSATGLDGERTNALLAFGYNIITGVVAPVYLAAVAAAAVGADGAAAVSAAARPAIETLSGTNADIDTISDAIAGGAPLSVMRAFGTNAAATAFRLAFENSSFADVYQSYIDSGRVRTRGSDVDIDGEDRFERFYKREIENGGPGSRALNPQETVGLLARVVGFVNSSTAPASLTAGELKSYRAAVPSDAVTAATSGGRADGYLTRLSLPADRLPGNMKLASPFNSGQTVSDPSALASADDISQTVIFTGASVGGSRAPVVRASASSASARGRSMFGGSGLRGAPTFSAELAIDANPDTTAGQPSRLVNQNMTRRWAEAKSRSNVLQRIAELMFISSPITRAGICSFARNDICLPMAHAILRPHNTVTAAAFIWMSRPDRRPFGFTAVHDPTVEYAYDATTSTYDINVALYTETVITDAGAILITPDVFVTGYVGGGNLKPFRAAYYDPSNVRNPTRSSPSIIIVAMPAESLYGPRNYLGSGRDNASMTDSKASFGEIFDIRGRMGNAALGNENGRAALQAYASIDTDEQLRTPLSGGDNLLYSSAFFYNYRYKFYAIDTAGVVEDCKLNARLSYDNTVVLGESQLLSVNGGAVPDTKIRGIDHFKNSTYNGALDRRLGRNNSTYDTLADREAYLSVVSR